MAADQSTRSLQPVRALLHTVVAPIYVVAEVPYVLGDAASNALFVVRENERLRGEVLALSAAAQRNAALAEENRRLRALLGSSARLEVKFGVAEIVGAIADPRAHELIVDRGRDDGVRIGYPVVDAQGLIGQVVEVGLTTARVLLITDRNHATPVAVNRNGYRAIAHGTGSDGALELAHVSHTVDLREGDLLVTSGMGQRFPPGYPVARVDHVRHDPGKPFAEVRARPTAQLDRGRHVLVLYPERGAPEAVDGEGSQASGGRGREAAGTHRPGTPAVSAVSPVARGGSAR